MKDDWYSYQAGRSVPKVTRKPLQPVRIEPEPEPAPMEVVEGDASDTVIQRVKRFWGKQP